MSGRLFLWEGNSLKSAQLYFIFFLRNGVLDNNVLFFSEKFNGNGDAKIFARRNFFKLRFFAASVQFIDSDNYGL